MSPRPDKGSMGVYVELPAILRVKLCGSSIAMGLLRGVGESRNVDEDDLVETLREVRGEFSA